MDVEKAKFLAAAAANERVSIDLALVQIRAQIDRLTAERDKLLWERENAVTRELEALRYIEQFQKGGAL